MTTVVSGMSPRVNEILNTAKQFSPTERLVLAKLLLDSIVSDEVEEEADWRNVSLAAFEREWDNPEDGIYDNWRELYGVSAR